MRARLDALRRRNLVEGMLGHHRLGLRAGRAAQS